MSDGEEDEGMNEQQMEDNLVSRKVYNDVIDEEIDLEKPEDIEPNAEKIENNHIDEVVQITSDSGEEEVPSPRDETGHRQVGPLDDLDQQPQPFEGDGGENEGGFDGYNPSDYMNQNVGPEILNLFKYITNYMPTTTEIETIFRPFIPEYIPTVGEVDAFQKIPPPDGNGEFLGLNQIDE